MAPPAAAVLPLLLLFVFILLANAEGETSPPTPVDSQQPDAEVKCGSCPCTNPCVQQSPPPPRPPPPPNCSPAMPHPPPPPRFIYTTGVPGNLYQTDANDRWYYYSSAKAKPAAAAALVVALGCGILDFMAFGKW